MTEPQPTDTHVPESRPSRTPAKRRDRGRLVAAAVIGAVMAVFALVNLDNVKVHWLIATGQTPLIVVIALAFALGMIADRLVVIRARRKRRATSGDAGSPSAT